jgi:O-antigen/teichoic acid export membrane protein
MQGALRLRVLQYKDHALTLGAQGLIYAQGLILTPLLIRSVGPDGYGRYLLVYYVMTFLLSVMSMLIGYTAKRRLPSTGEHAARWKLYMPQLVIHLGGLALASSGIALLLAAFGIPDRFGMAPEVLVSATAGVLALGVFGQAVDYYRFTGRVSVFNGASAIQAYGFVIALLLVGRAGIKLEVSAVLGIQAAAVAATSVLLAVAALAELQPGPINIRRSELASDLRVGLPLVASLVASTILSVGDRYLIAGLISVTAVAHYGPAYALGSMILFIPNAVGVFLPARLASATDHGDADAVRRELGRAIGLYVTIALPFAVGATLLSDQLLAVYISKDAAQAARGVMPIVACGAGFYGVALILWNQLYVGGKTGVMLASTFAAGAVNIVMNIVLLSTYRSIFAAAAATFAGYAVAFLVTIRVVGIDWLDVRVRRTIVRSMAGTCSMAASVLLLYPQIASAQELGIAVATAVVVYGAASGAAGYALTRLPLYARSGKVA